MACYSAIQQALAEALKQNGTATLAISGGSTPRLLFQEMLHTNPSTHYADIFWVDERCVPPTDPQSNFRLANDVWFTPAMTDPKLLHRIYGELPPEEGARKYVADIKEFFHLKEGELPVFDVVHRGMGPDMHTASLFPGEPLIQNRTDIATNVWVEKMQMHRVTLLPGVLLAAKKTFLQVCGADKADGVKTVLEAPEDWMKYPCQMASRDSKATWFLDSAAAAKL